MNSAVAAMQAVRTALVTYANAGPDYLPETVRLMVMLLVASAYMLPLADEFMAAVPRGDKSSLTPLVPSVRRAYPISMIGLLYLLDPPCWLQSKFSYLLGGGSP